MEGNRGDDLLAHGAAGAIASDGSIPGARDGEANVATPRAKMNALALPNNTVSAMTFDGKALTVHYYSGNTQSFPATSGRPGITDPRLRSQGPLPSGLYFLKHSDISKAGFFRKFTGDWGQYRVRLHAAPGTETFGRDEFFLHGGAKPGSAGCIDCGAADTKIFSILQRQPNPVPVIVTLPWKNE
jgi:hypothetical protein